MGNLTGLIGPYTWGMETVIVLLVCALILLAIAGLVVWAKFHPRRDDDAVERDWMDAIK